MGYGGAKACAFAAAAAAAALWAHDRGAEHLTPPPAVAAFPWAKPRTDSQAVAAGWMGKHLELKALAAQLDAAGTRVDWVLMGDSITAYFRAPGKAAALFPGQKVFVAGLGGDRLDSLAWRVADGGVPRTPPRAARVLIGTNNLPEWSYLPPEKIAERLVELVRFLRARWPETPLLVQLLFDRATFADPVRETNGRISAAFAAAAIAGVSVVACGTPSSTAAAGTPGAALVPGTWKMHDGLHPGDAGQAEVLACTRAKFPALFEPSGPAAAVWPLLTPAPGRAATPA